MSSRGDTSADQSPYDECENEQATYQGMVAHIRDVHDGALGECLTCQSLSDCAEHVCPCGRDFLYKSDLKSHAVKTGHRPYRCERGSCTKSYRKLKELMRHHRDHDAEGGESGALAALIPVFTCMEAGCSKTYKLKKALDTHHAGVHVGRRGTLFQLRFI